MYDRTTESLWQQFTYSGQLARFISLLPMCLLPPVYKRLPFGPYCVTVNRTRLRAGKKCFPRVIRLSETDIWNQYRGG
jgi:hypothetical protein